MVIVTLFCSFAFVVSAEDAKATDEKEYVATVYVCQEMQPPYIIGHTWLYFVNLTNHEITVGLYTLPKGQGVSIGTYGLSIKGGRGLYYNIEGYRYNNPYKVKDCVFLCTPSMRVASIFTTQSRIRYSSRSAGAKGLTLFLPILRLNKINKHTRLSCFTATFFLVHLCV